MKSLFTRFFLAAGAALLLQTTAIAQTTPVDSVTANRLQTKLDQLLAQYNLKGLSATVIIPDKGTWRGVTGVSHGSVAIDSTMSFAIGSVTKNFTATAILMLQEDGLLSISDSLHEFLPTYPNVNPNITIKQLLQHTSGIYNYTNNTGWQNMVNNYPAQSFTADTVLNYFIGAPVFSPGASFQYSNTNYMLLGEIIEQVTNAPYHTYIRQRILDPLQMSSYYMSAFETPFGVLPHNWSDPDMNGIGVNDIYYFPLTAVFSTGGADGGLVGNSYHLARYAQALFTGQLLQDTSLTQMTTFRPTGGGGFNGYGLGLMRYIYQGKQVWGHGGNIAGFAASMFFSTSDSIVVTLQSNQDVVSPNLALALLGEARASLINAVAGEVSASPNSLLCYPNPASGTSTIRYVLPQQQKVSLSLHNSLGQEIQLLQTGIAEAGENEVKLDSNQLPTGVYFVRLTTENHTSAQRLIISH